MRNKKTVKVVALVIVATMLVGPALGLIASVM